MDATYPPFRRALLECRSLVGKSHYALCLDSRRRSRPNVSSNHKSWIFTSVDIKTSSVMDRSRACRCTHRSRSGHCSCFRCAVREKRIRSASMCTRNSLHAHTDKWQSSDRLSLHTRLHGDRAVGSGKRRHHGRRRWRWWRNRRRLGWWWR